MAESQRRLLARELAEFNSGEREFWSAPAVHRAARIIRDLPSDPGFLRLRCRELENSIADVFLGPSDSYRPAEPLRQLESRAWLLAFSNEENPELDLNVPRGEWVRPPDETDDGEGMPEPAAW